MADRYTMRNRRSPELRAEGERVPKSRFAMDTVEAAPATPTRPAWPFGNLARASVDYLTRLAADEIGSQLDSPRGKRRRGTQALLEHLSTFDGQTPGTILNNLRRRCQILGETNPAFRGLHFTPHDFRRLFATDLVNNGLPIHIGAALLGHVNLQTTQGYVAVFEEDVIRHTQEFLARRRAMRPQEEYRPATDQEWFEFEEHFDKRKVELGSCGRPYGTDCHHEHACLRCPQLHVNPKMLPRLDELEADLKQRWIRATTEGWIGEIEGIDRTLSCLRDKRSDALRLIRITRQVDLGMPKMASPR